MNVAKAKVGFVEPMLALAVTKLPEGPAWAYERLKFDGYRALGLKTAGRVRLLSRNGKDFTRRFASIAQAPEMLPDETVIDGEIIAYGDDGRPSFNVLQNHRGAGPELHLYAFDLLTLCGRDLTREPLEKRREILRAHVMPRLPSSIRYSETMEASPAELIEAVREQGFEGIVAKRRDSPYKPGQRSAVWQKMRVLQRRDFVIGGFIPAGRNFDAILIGDYEGRALKYVAKVHSDELRETSRRRVRVSVLYAVTTGSSGPRSLAVHRRAARQWLALTVHAPRERRSTVRRGKPSPASSRFCVDPLG